MAMAPECSGSSDEGLQSQTLTSCPRAMIRRYHLCWLGAFKLTCFSDGGVTLVRLSKACSVMAMSYFISACLRRPLSEAVMALVLGQAGRVLAHDAPGRAA